MLNTWYLLCTDLTGDFGVAAAGVIPVYAMDKKGLVSELYGAAGNFPFAIAVQRGMEDFASVVLLLSHPFYHRGLRGKPLFLTGGNGTVVREELYRQGIDADVCVVDVSVMPGLVYSVRGSHVAPWSGGEDPAVQYCRYCLQEYDPEDSFLVVGNGPLTAMQSGLAIFRDQYPELYARTALIVQLMREREQLSRVGKLQREERAILQELLELAGRSDEVHYILNFYKHEYEILPLWYKRMGHILKVMMGKRSFRSLYDKKAKKYST